MHYENIVKKIVNVLILSVVLNVIDVNADSLLGDPYTILDLDRKANDQDIRKAYRKLVKKWFVRFSLIFLTFPFSHLHEHCVEFCTQSPVSVYI